MDKVGIAQKHLELEVLFPTGQGSTHSCSEGSSAENRDLGNAVQFTPAVLLLPCQNGPSHQLIPGVPDDWVVEYIALRIRFTIGDTRDAERLASSSSDSLCCLSLLADSVRETETKGDACRGKNHSRSKMEG